MQLKDVLKLVFAGKKPTPKIPEAATSIDDELSNADWLHQKPNKEKDDEDKGS